MIQTRLTLVSPNAERRPAPAEILGLTRELIRIRSQGGIDDQGPILRHVAGWLETRGVGVEILTLEGRTNKNKSVGLLCAVGDATRGPTYALTACLDTAPFGSSESWENEPDRPILRPDGWLVGRGAADSKIGAAIFCRIMADLAHNPQLLNGRLILLLDSDEHTGRFGAIKLLVKRIPEIDGVYIGYSGARAIRVGARGFYRAKVRVFGVAAHSGSSRPAEMNAVQKASVLVTALHTRNLPREQDESFPLQPKLTVTHISGGKGFSTVPDSCILSVDMRLTPSFNQREALAIVRQTVDEIDRSFPGPRNSKIDSLKGWPAYRLSADKEIVSALKTAAESNLGRPLPLEISGPSNVGNFLYSEGIPATCGFGVNELNVHGADEMIDTADIAPIYESYRQAVLTLLR